MGATFVKHLESANYNRKLFYLDRGAEDLPEIINHRDIMPGSECRSLTTGERWILNTHFKWVYIDENWICNCGGNTGDGSTDPITPGEEPVIEGVTINPTNITVGLGAKISFQAQIVGDSALTQGITWTIKGQTSKDTKISKDGILTIADDETCKTITVRATAQGDSTKYAQAVVTVDAEIENPLDPVVTGITIIPSEAEIILGKDMMFNAIVSGVNITDNSVTYSISGQDNPNTTINADGVLHVDINEGSRVIIVTAASVLDPEVKATSTVSVTDEQHATNPDNANITEVVIIPENVTVGKGYSTQFAAQVRGTGNPSQEVVYRVSGHTSADTYITNNGTLYVGADEETNLITVTAHSVYAPDKVASADVVVVSADTPGVDKVTVDAVVINPAMAELAEGTWLVFSATVIGQNSPSQKVIWELEGANVQTTYISEQGTVVIGVGETAKTLKVIATSEQDKTKSATAYITIAEQDVTPATGIEDVPESPLNTQYVRERDENGRAVWTPVEIDDGDTGEDLGPDPEITAIKVQPEAVTVAPGSVIQFIAIKEGSDELADTVTWTISGQQSAKTIISGDGVLTIGEDEASRIIKVKATSTVDTTKSGMATISVDKEADPVEMLTGLYLVPAEAQLIRGKSMRFQAIITGVNLTNKEVEYRLAGNIYPDTKIDNTGLLVVNAKETSSVLVITAKAVADESLVDTSVVSVIPEELADPDDIATITSFTILPSYTQVGRGMNAQFAAQVIGVNNPSSDVIWEIEGASDVATHISRDGVLYVGANEDLHEITVKATAVYDPSKTSEARAMVISEETPGIDETTVNAVIISPPSGEVNKGGRVTFKATVIGQNNPSQEVRWSLEGNSSNRTTISKVGVLNVAGDEAANVLMITATSVADETKMATAYMTVSKAQTTPETGIEDVPNAPLDQNYVRHVDANGKKIWLKYNEIPHKDFDNIYVRGRDEEDNPVWIPIPKCPEEPAEYHIERLENGTLQWVSVPKCPKEAAQYHLERLPNGTLQWVPVPECPKEQGKYILERLEDGALQWIPVPECPDESAEYNLKRKPDKTLEWVKDTGGGRPDARMFYGTVDTYTDLTRFEIPADAKDGDFIFVEEDETHEGAPSMYEVYTDEGVKKFRFVMNFSRMDTFEGKMYLGTFDTKAALDEYVVPEIANPGDFVYVKNDESKNRCPAMYEVYDDGGQKKMRFVMSFGRPPILGDKLDILFILDNTNHSQYLKDIEIMADFDHTDKRYELYTSSSAWHLVTELHEGFWDEVMKHPDWYKMIVGMARADGSTRAYLTCFTDDHEFEHYKEIDIDNPDPIQNKLTWTNTVQPGNVFTAANDTRLVQYLFHLDTMSLTVGSQEEIPPDTVPGVTPWATVIGEYSTLANGTTIGPLAEVTDPTGYVWVSEHEKFMLGSAGDGSQMFCYNIDTDDYFIFTVPNESRKEIWDVDVPFSLATDVNERYFFLFITGNIGVWGDRVAKQSKIINWHPTGYRGLSDPGPYTKPGIDPTGKFYMHTSTESSTPTFTSFSFDTGDIVTEGPVDGTSSSAICLNNNAVFTNTPEGRIITYNFDPVGGTLTVRAHADDDYTPFAARYVAEATTNGNQILCVKVEEKADCPAWFVYDCDRDTIIAQSAKTSDYCEQTNGQAKSCTYELSTSAGQRYLLSLANRKGGIVIKYEGSTWTEVEIPFGGLNNNKNEYNQPILMQDGQILVTQDEDGNPVGFDLVKMEIVDLESILNPGGDPHMVQLDDKHFMWCTDTGSQLIRQEADGTRKVVLEIPEQQCLVYGFGRQSDRKVGE